MIPLLRKPLPRRTILRGLGSAALSLPLLNSMQPRHAHAQLQRPRRLFFEFKPNGDEVDRRFTSVGETDFEFGEFLAPLEPYRQDLVVVNRLTRPYLDIPRNERGDNHQCGGASLAPWIFGEGTFPVGGENRFIGPVLGPSVDYVLGDRVLAANPTVPYRHLVFRVGDRENNLLNMLAHAGPEGTSSPISPETSPASAYARLFGSAFANSDERVELERRLAAHRSMLDLLVGENQALISRLPFDDRARVEQHTDALRDIERSLVLPTERQDCSGGDSVLSLIENPLDPAVHAEVGALFHRITALALACDLTRVVNFAWAGSANNRIYRSLGLQEAHHDVSHKTSPEAFAQIRAIHRHLWEQSAGLYEVLKRTPEGEGSLWDSTLIVHWNELGQGNVHSLQDAMVVLAGKADGAFQTGRYLDYENRVSFGQLLVSAFHYLGFNDVEQFGDPRLSDTGPLARL